MNRPFRDTHETAEYIRTMSDDILIRLIIKPCKHCGCSEIHIFGDGTEGNGWKLYCEQCGIQTSSYIGKTPNRAIESWNREPS